MKIIFQISWPLLFFNISIASEHPFLIVRKSMYYDLQQKSLSEPWKTLKADAISKAYSSTFPVNGNVFNRTAEGIRDIMNSCALAYILDSLNRVYYKNKIYETIKYWPSIYADINPAIWVDSVPSGNGFVLSILALDIIFDDLTEAQRNIAINNLRPPNPWPFNWPHNQSGTKVVWFLFLNDKVQFNAAKTVYLNELYNETSNTGFIQSDGSYLSGSSYAFSRLGADVTRGASKTHVMDILSFVGEHNFYEDQRINSFYRWISIFSRNPFGGLTSFGDTIIQKDFKWLNSRTLTLSRFSEDVASLSARWSMSPISEYDKRLSLFGYLMANKSFSQIPLKVTKSEIFMDSGAAFWENHLSSEALMGALLNLKRTDGHSHKEVNAIYIAAYGEHILLNAGYAGWGNGVPGFNWNWFSRNAHSANTVMIDSLDHKSNGFLPVPGRGVSEGFTSRLLDYVSGASGEALPNGHHQRNFLFIHPQDKAHGYFVLFDEVDSINSGGKSQILIHPNSNNHSILAEKKEYQWKISGLFLRNQNRETYLSVFLATPPETVVIKDGAMAGSSSYLIGKYMEAHYSLDNLGKKNMATILFPHDQNHLKPTISRISTNDFNGAEVSHAEAGKDLVLSSIGTHEFSYAHLKFLGESALMRMKNNNLVFYFVRQASKFEEHSAQLQGFLSDKPISMHLKNGEGAIISPGAKITFYYPHIMDLRINGKIVTPIYRGKDQIQVFIDKGNFSISLLTDGLSERKTPAPPVKIEAKILSE